MGIPFYLIHLKAHHRIDYVSNYKLDFLTFVEYMVWTLLTLSFFAVYHFLFVDWIAWVFIGEGAIVATFTHYVHDQYDSKNPWMIRYTWFVKSRKLHRTHHSFKAEVGCFEPFMKAKNYAFGGPLTINLADHCLGTFASSKGGES
ncbi:MAG: hypothetical protein HQK84_08535 [Nitrospinae bacterium]|nr:hypothetical protein [Nitrospinota bacterium]